jgi:heme exporter protein D
MYFQSFADFLAMGHHGPYVWSAWGLTLAIVLWNILQPWRTRRRLLREQAALLRREQGATPRKPAAPGGRDAHDSSP